MGNTPSRYREIEVAGAPREMGRQLGEAARQEVRGFCEVALERVNKTVAVSRQRAYDVAERSLQLAEEYAPDYVEELRGVSDAAGVSLVELMLLQVRNQLTPGADKPASRAVSDAGCTSLSIAEVPGSGPVVAQNWDNDPLLDEFTVVLRRRPPGKPAMLHITQAGLIAYIGLNDAGIGACLNTLPAPSRDVGVPHYFTLRGLYEATSLQQAATAVQRARRAIPANIMLATPQGPADFEVTLDDVHVLRPENADWITHTNHCLHRELCDVNRHFPELIQSHPRKARIDGLLRGVAGEITLHDVKAALRDHDRHPRSICRHANDDPLTGFWQTVFSVIVEPQRRCLHATRGTPCDREYETYSL